MGKRIRVIGRRRTMIVVTLAALLLAVGVVVGSGANFMATGASTGNVFTAGYIAVDTNGQPVLSVGPLAPGDMATHGVSGTVGVQNAGDVSGDFYLDLGAVTNTPGPSGGNLSDVLNVQVQDFAGAVVYTGRLVDMTEVNCGSLAAGASDTATVVAWIPDSDAGAGTRGGDNAYMQSELDATLNWTAVSN